MFRIADAGYQHLVIKVPKFTSQVDQTYPVEDLIYDTQLSKIYAGENVPTVVEEMIVINSIDSTVESYMVIMEEPELSLDAYLRNTEDKGLKDKNEVGSWH